MSPPGGLRLRLGLGGSWGPALLHTDQGHTLGKEQNVGTESRTCLVTSRTIPGSAQYLART
jgi:hypothetical protein